MHRSCQPTRATARLYLAPQEQGDLSSVWRANQHHFTNVDGSKLRLHDVCTRSCGCRTHCLTLLAVIQALPHNHRATPRHLNSQSQLEGLSVADVGDGNVVQNWVMETGIPRSRHPRSRGPKGPDDMQQHRTRLTARLAAIGGRVGGWVGGWVG